MNSEKLYLTFVCILLLLINCGAKEYVRGCYFTSWAVYRPGRGKFTPNDYMPGLCTHILYAFAGIADDGTVK